MENSNINVLITRPLMQSHRLADRLKQFKIKTRLFPTLLIHAVEDQSLIFKSLKQLHTADHIIFTSANAVHNTIPLWLEPWTKIKSGVKLFAIGSATAEALASYQLSAQIPTDYTSEGLLTIPDLESVKNQKIIIFTGQNGRGHLEQVLSWRGAQLDVAITYVREKPNSVPTALLDEWNFINLIISTSQESLKNLFELMSSALQERLFKTPLLVISQKMEELAREFNFQTVVRAENPTDEAVITALLKWLDLSQPVNL